MPNMEQQFRTAVFGGYQKQDVLNYIDAASKEQRGREESHLKELEAEKKARAALEQQHAALEQKHADLEKQTAALEGQLKDSAAALEEKTAALDASTARLTTLEDECAALRARLAKAEPAARAYEAVKDRTAGLELEAHQRAREAEEAARVHARETQVHLGEWLSKIRVRYDELRTDMAATGAHAAGELMRLAEIAEQLSAEFDAQDEAMDRFARLCAEGDGPKPPAPLPLDGE